jgi:uncharacterized protein involved in outer membrane biogenesis
MGRIIVRLLVVAVVVLVLYAGAGFVAVPMLARYYALPALSGWLGRELSVGQVHFNPFTLTAELIDLKALKNEGDASSGVALGFGRIMANFEVESLWRGGPVVRELAIGHPYLSLARLDDGRIDWSDVFARLRAGSQTDDDEEDEEPVLFSVGNIHIEDGTIDLEDRVTGTKHSISSLRLGIPVISRLAVQVDAAIRPEISMLLDGQPLAAKGSLESSPEGFSAALEQLTIRDLDLPSWLLYLPFEPSFRLFSGALDLDLRVNFEQREGGEPSVSIQGRAQVNHLAIQDRSTGRPLLTAPELEAELGKIEPLAGYYRFVRLRLQQPEFDLVRLPNGRFNVEDLLSVDKARPAKTSKTSKASKTATALKPLDVEISLLRIRDGLIRYNDHAVGGGFSTRVEAIQLDLRDLSSGLNKMPAAISLDYATASGARFSHQDRLRLRPFEYSGKLTVSDLQPALYGRYYAAFLPGGEIRQGRAEGILHYRIVEEEGVDRLLFEAGIERLSLSNFVLGLSGRKRELLRVRNLNVAETGIFPATRQIRIGEINAQGAAVSTVRLPGGRFDFMALAGQPSPASAAWAFHLDKAAISGASLRFEDQTADEPVVMTADGIEAQLSNLSNAKNARTPAGFTLRGRFDKNARLSAKGNFVPEPLRTDLDFELQGFPLASVQPYIAHRARLGIRTGRLSAKGRLALRQQRGNLSGSWSGHLAVNDFSSFDRINNTDFVRWNEFAMRQARVDLEPFALSVGEMSIDGLHSRLILDESGKLNLREIQQQSTGQEAPERAESGIAESETGTETTGPQMAVKIARIAFRNSNIAFSDRFIRPNYNALLGNLSGELTGLSSDPASLAKLDLQGHVGRSAPLSIKGEFNPFRQDHHLNIEASVKDFELSDLSGYSGRYIGYGISRGRLSATLNYRIEDRKLSAENHVFLDQLTFGDAVESPEATNLPVRLAVALLKNARGEIEVHLPVGGTLDDPQFSVFGLVLRALGGLIAKAVTAPFALLGREELSFLDFDPGSSRIGAAQEEKLRGLAKALEDRPLLKLDISGFASAERDTDGIRRNKLRFRVIAEKRKTTGKSGPPEDNELSDEEYPRFLEEVYDNARIRKPRNFIGLSKSLPVEEMEKLLLASITVGAEDVDALARRREMAVQRWLTDQGGIPPERIFRRTPTEAEAREEGREGNVRFSLR